LEKIKIKAIISPFATNLTVSSCLYITISSTNIPKW
jgi:hypothetical protein